MAAIQITTDILTRLTADARRDSAREHCGLLAGRDGIIAQAFAARNVASDPAKGYEIAPEDLFKLMREIRGSRLELLGIYHSHPNGENKPSPRDIEHAYYPDAAYVIVSPQPDAPQPVRAFSIRDGRATELTIRVV
ncbi:MAG: M67 family metallopeptidase [Candidatus Acidiferrales bacterium]|jgi:proteasome lid subunit RPN8/RPN11